VGWQNMRRRIREPPSDGAYKLVRAYAAALGLDIGANALRATAATNTRSTTRPTSPRRHRHHPGSTIIARRGRRTARPLR